MLCEYLPAHSKFKFFFLELSRIFFLNIYDQWVVESMDSEHTDMEDQLYTVDFHTCIKKSQLENMVEVNKGNFLLMGVQSRKGQ